ncbi:hypothetical protein JKP88DRAFT_296870 [Tribonema minus]|uniref:Ankyrin repeat domain containing protein n=1 Tax=Tribonema minus TaxID=303371 RepID=A0A835ZF11_9STRA|nr:hypothetical protein JKP88DRAFT_296870 [Tribonema minus]
MAFGNSASAIDSLVTAFDALQITSGAMGYSQQQKPLASGREPATVANLDDCCLEHVFSFVGQGHYIFLACCKRWQYSYWSHCQFKMETAVQNVTSSRSLIQWAVDEHGGGLRMSANTCAIAASSGHFASLRWLREQGCEMDKRTCAGAPKTGDFAMLFWARANNCPWDDSTACEALQRDDFTMLEWMTNAGFTIKWVAEAMTAARRGHLEVLRQLHQQGHIPDFNEQCLAAEGGHLEVLKWLWELGGLYSEDVSTLAAAGGHLHVIEWLVDTIPGAVDEDTCAMAAQFGHLHVLRFAHERGCPWDSRVCRVAAHKGHLDVLRYAREHGCPWVGAEVARCAADGGGLAVLQWAVENGCGWDATVCEIAAGRGDVEMLEWALASGAPCRYAALSSSASATGHVAVAKWLRARGRDIGALLLSAARNGHVAVVNWGLTAGVAAGDDAAHALACAAAEAGRVEVLAWMHAAGRLVRDVCAERCCAAARFQAGGAHTSTSTSTSTCTIASRAARGGHVRVLRWLRAHALFDARGVYAEAADRGHAGALAWARANGCEWEESATGAAAPKRRKVSESAYRGV